MLVDVVVAVLVVGGPAIAIGLVIGPLCGRGRIATVLGPIVGLALMVLALRALSNLGAGGELKTALIAIAGLLAAAFAALRRRTLVPLLPPAAAALAIVALLAWPLSGRSDGTILGYNIINDSAYHATTAHWLAVGQPPILPGSSTNATVDGIDSGYPAGAHELVALAVPVSPNGIWGAFQPVLAVILALGAFPAYWALRRTGVKPPLAALGSVLAAAGYLQYAFYSESLLPQMAATPLVFGSLALAVEGVLVRRLTPFVLGGITAVAAVLTYSLGLVVYLGPLYALALVLLVLRSRQRRRLLTVAGVGTAIVALVALTAFRPLVEQTVDFVDSSRNAIRDPNPAHLPGPADRRLVWGVWVGTDFRYPYERYRVTELGIQIAVLLASIGIVWALLRRRLALLGLLGAAVGGYLVIRDEASIYWIAKSYQVVAFPIALAVVAGAAALAAVRLRRVPALGALVAALLLAAYGVAAWRSLEYARAGTAYANPEISQLGDFGAAAADGLGVGLVFDDLAKVELPTLVNQFEFSFLPIDRGYAVGRTPATRVVDVDNFPSAFLDGYQYVIERRVGGLSLPPPPFALVQQTDDFRLWRRPAAGPLPPRRPAELPGREGGVVVAPGASLGLGDASWQRVRVGVRPQDGWYLPMSQFSTTGTVWIPWDGTAGVHWVSVGAGVGPAVYDLDVAVPGRYRASVLGSMTDSFRLVVDGQELRPLVATGIESRDGGQYLGTLELEAGSHRIEVWSPDGLARPRNVSFVQGVSLEREERPAPSAVCVNGERYEAAWDRPVETDADDGSVSIENCGDVPLFVDWVETLPVTRAG